MENNKGNNFKCICDIHWENMSLLECKDCSTVIKYYYDEYYEPNFRCPICTNYKTGYEFYTKEEIESSEELKAIIKMYENFNKIQKEQEERIEKRNGLLDNQICSPKHLKTKKGEYKFDLKVDSILNKNKLKGLRLEITKWIKEGCVLRNEWIKEIPLSIKAIQYYKYKKELEKNHYSFCMNKSLTQVMEEQAVKRLKR